MCGWGGMRGCVVCGDGVVEEGRVGGLGVGDEAGGVGEMEGFVGGGGFARGGLEEVDG